MYQKLKFKSNIYLRNNIWKEIKKINAECVEVGKRHKILKMKITVVN